MDDDYCRDLELSFGWLAVMDKILTMDNLWQCKKITVSGCIMCLVDVNL